jgi:uncharacterized protein YuzE
MSVTIAGTEFDSVFYDRDVDVLYLHVGDPSAAEDFEATPEGHHVRFASDGRLIGVTILNARKLLQDEGAITLTLPEIQVQASGIESALAAA